MRTERRTGKFRGFAVLIVLLMLAAPLAGAAQHGDQAGNGDQAGDGGDQGQAEDRRPNGTTGPSAADQRQRGQALAAQWQEMAQEKRNQALERAENAGLFSLLSYEDGQVDGRFVSFGVDETTGTVTDFTAKDGEREATYFTSIELDSFTPAGEARTAGAVFQLPGEDAVLAAHSNPTAQLRLTSGAPVNATFTLGENLTHNPAGPALRFDHSSGLHVHMLLSEAAGNLTLSEDNTTVTAELGANATLLVLTHPVVPTTLSSSLHERIEAAEAGNLGATVSVVGVDGTPAVEPTELGVSVDARSAGDGEVVLDVSSDDPAGKTVVVNVDNATLNGSAPEEITVTIDGQAIEGISQAADVLAATNGSAAQFAVTEVEGALQVTVFVPGFSLHTLAIASTADTTDDGTDDGTTDDGTDGGTDDGTDDGTDGGTGEDGTSETPFPGALLVLAALLVALVLRTGRD